MPTGLKHRHKGIVWGVYVVPAWRGNGLARALVTEIIEHARSAGLSVLHLSVTVSNDVAEGLYRSAGFESYGVQPRGLCVNGSFVDDKLMAMLLD